MLRPGQYTSGFKRGQDHITHKITYAGNHAKSLRVSVDASLKKLRTSYIDILYVHWWDWGTSVEEVIDSLNTLVLQGKVLYLVRLHLVRLYFPEILAISFSPGHLRYSRVDRLQSESVRQGPWEDPVQHLSRQLVHPRTVIRARYYPHGAFRGSCTCSLGCTPWWKDS